MINLNYLSDVRFARWNVHHPTNFNRKSSTIKYFTPILSERTEYSINLDLRIIKFVSFKRIRD